MPGIIGFLVFNGVQFLDFAGPYEAFSVWRDKFKGPEKIVIISQKVGDITCANGNQIKSTHDFSNCPELDYLVIPGGIGARTEVNNEILVSFVQKASKNCKAILSVCTGAFLLQKAGLLDGKKATTHWALLNELRALENITVVEERYVKDENIWTSSGVSSGIDLALAFIADISGGEVAGDVQSFMEYYPMDKRYGSFHNSQKAPQYLKVIGGNKSSFFQSEQNIKDKPNASSNISKNTPAQHNSRSMAKL